MYRPRLNEEEYNLIQQYRKNKDTFTPPYDTTDLTNERFVKYCKDLNLDISKVKSYKFVNHNGQEAFNIAFHEEEQQIDYDYIKEYIEDDLKKLKYTPSKASSLNLSGVGHLADLHFGAYIDNLTISQPFSINVLSERLNLAADISNRLNYKEFHVHILGDIIESFTGLNHINSWKGLEKGMIGARLIRLTVEILHKSYLSKINNLGKIKIISGNHDRVTSKNDEDVQGGAAELIAWGLELIGYDVEFNPLVITHRVDDINYILLHGHHGISKKQTKDICWDYGVKGAFNYVEEGHLHSRIQKLSTSQMNKFSTILDDSVDVKRHIMPSFFTGNFYSESNGWTTTPGYVVTEDNGSGKPNTFDFSL